MRVNAHSDGNTGMVDVLDIVTYIAKQISPLLEVFF
jgi:hypothetical protein